MNKKKVARWRKSIKTIPIMQRKPNVIILHYTRAISWSAGPDLILGSSWPISWDELKISKTAFPATEIDQFVIKSDKTIYKMYKIHEFANTKHITVCKQWSTGWPTNTDRTYFSAWLSSPTKGGPSSFSWSDNSDSEDQSPSDSLMESSKSIRLGSISILWGENHKFCSRGGVVLLTKVKTKWRPVKPSR